MTNVSAASCLGNIGPGFNLVGPTMNFSDVLLVFQIRMFYTYDNRQTGALHSAGLIFQVLEP